MPLVRINMKRGRSAEAKRAMADAVQRSLVDVLGVPDADRYQLIHEFESERFIHTPGYLDLKYTDDLVIIEIVFIEGRSEDLKKDLIRTLNRQLVEAADLRSDDVFVVIQEVARANISFGNGLAQRAM